MPDENAFPLRILLKAELDKDALAAVAEELGKGISEGTRLGADEAAKILADTLGSGVSDELVASFAELGTRLGAELSEPLTNALLTSASGYGDALSGISDELKEGLADAVRTGLTDGADAGKAELDTLFADSSDDVKAAVSQVFEEAMRLGGEEGRRILLESVQLGLSEGADKGVDRLLESLGDVSEATRSALVTQFQQLGTIVSGLMKNGLENGTKLGADEAAKVLEAILAPVLAGITDKAAKDAVTKIQNAAGDMQRGTPTYGPTTSETRTGEGQDRDDSRLADKWSPIIMRGVSLGAQGIKELSQESMNFLQMIYRYVKQSSPLMQAIESLFNLAVQLFFLPFGTALAETLLPSILDLVDDVADMWDAMDGMTLGEMADYMVEQAGKLFGSYIESISESLSEQGGILGSIGDFLQSLGSFVQENGASIIDLMLSLAGMFLDNFKEFISLYIGLQTAQIAATIASSTPLVGALVGGVIGGGATYTALSAYGMADGGYVPSTQGGQLRLLAEGGEGEHVVPDSKVKDFADEHSSKGSNTYNINVYGYTDSELTDRINDVINQQVAFSRLKGSFRWEEQPHSAPSGAGTPRSTA